VTLNAFPQPALNRLTTEVIYENVVFVQGADTSVTTLAGMDSGSYTLSLTDFEFPEALDYLGVSITTATDLVGQLLLGNDEVSNTMSFLIDSPDTYYLSVFGMAGSAYNVGMYGIELSKVGVSAVPLPPAAFLFFTGLIGLIFVGRGKAIICLPHTPWFGLA